MTARLICGHGGHLLAGIYFLWAILLKQHAKQSIRRDRNDQKAARDNLEQSTPPNTLGHSTKNSNASIGCAGKPLQFA
jgi:hypothetical protein